MKPDWVVYRNDQRIGQGRTWHKGLDIALKDAGLSCYTVYLWISKQKVKFNFADDRYDIIKEK